MDPFSLIVLLLPGGGGGITETVILFVRIMWVMLWPTMELLTCWEVSFKRHPNKLISMVLPLYLMLCMEREILGHLKAPNFQWLS